MNGELGEVDRLMLTFEKDKNFTHETTRKDTNQEFSFVLLLVLFCG